MWKGDKPQSFGKPEEVTSWKELLQSDLLEIQDPSNVAQQLCRILMQIVSHSRMVNGSMTIVIP